MVAVAPLVGRRGVNQDRGPKAGPPGDARIGRPGGSVTAIRMRPMTAEDWPAVRDIYEAGIATGNATFETSSPSWQDWDRAHHPDCRLVAEAAGGEVVGWVAVSPVSERCVYGGVVEVSVYVAEAARGQGVGRALLEAVTAATERAGMWTVQAGVHVENAASLALHRRAGFRVVGIRERIGRDAHGRWRDVVLLERRSKVASSDGG